LLSSFSATENENFSLFGFSTKYERKTISKLEKQQTKERKQNTKIYQT
jgi:hypothetical protein